MLEGHERTLLAAQGYSELSMYDDALAELDALPAEAANNSAVLELRAVILMQAKRWKAALASSRELCRNEPEKTSGYIHAAFCLHELGRTREALECLQTGPDGLEAEPTFHYNLACYECALGHLEVARTHLEKSFALDKKMREFAKSDPDLAAMWG